MTSTLLRDNLAVPIEDDSAILPEPLCLLPDDHLPETPPAIVPIHPRAAAVLEVEELPDSPEPVNGKPETDGRPAPEGHLILCLYFRDLGAWDRLSPDEEIALALLIKAGDMAARERLIKAHLRLVVKIAKDYAGLGVPLLDLISEGNIGLMKAVERYDPGNGARVSTYAAHYIKQGIRRTLANDARVVRLPIHVQAKMYTAGQSELRLRESTGREPTDEAVASESAITASNLRIYRQAMQHSVSLDEAVGEDSHRTVAETVADENMPSPPEQIGAGETLDHLASAIGGLPEREQTILRLRFGLEDGCERTLDEIGVVVGLNRERVRQLQVDALRKLRRLMKEVGVT